MHYLIFQERRTSRPRGIRQGSLCSAVPTHGTVRSTFCIFILMSFVVGEETTLFVIRNDSENKNEYHDRYDSLGK